jgi:hypothetical protein
MTGYYNQSPGQGAQFTLDLPLKLEKEPHEYAREPTSAAG